METSDDEQITTIIAEGGKEDLERFSKTLQLPERGKVYVRGIFESNESPMVNLEAAGVIEPMKKEWDNR